jgi:protein-disulfide isomerase
MRALAVVALIGLTACSSSAQSARRPAAADVVATVGSTKITLAEVDDRALRQSAGGFGSLSLEQALYQARLAAIDELVGDRLLEDEARARGIDRVELTTREIIAKVSTPTDAEIAAWFQQNQARTQGATLDQLRQPIKDMLVEQRTASARGQFLDGLKAKTAVTIALEPPRVAVDDAGRPARGPSDAPVQIVEFSDFQCPFCQRAYPTVMQVLKTYGDRVRLVYRHYPLQNHPAARPAAEASACAADQGKFWEYHDKLFANASRLSDADLKQHAADLGLDAQKFNACVDTRKFQGDVEADRVAGDEAGVSGTPAFFINGRPISGAQPFEAFKRVIDEELARR